MIDPITALSAASLAFNGVKKAIQVGRDMEDIFRQLSTWSGHVSDLQEWMGQERKFKKPTLWQKLTWDKSETAEAFDELIAKKKIKAKRKAQIYDQIRARKRFFYNTKMGVAIGTLVLILIWLLHFAWTAITEASK